MERLLPVAALVCAALGGAPSGSTAQDLRLEMGSIPRLVYAGSADPAFPRTRILTFAPANVSGFATSATFGWSTSPCSAAVKIKFFRPSPLGQPTRFEFLEERGPFDVTSPFRPAPGQPPVIQTVALQPPVPLQAGDVVAIANLMFCGAPVFEIPIDPVPFGGPRPTFPYAGDLRGRAAYPSELPEPYILLNVTGDPALVLLQGRFEVTLGATDPRTDEPILTVPRRLTEESGYFSFPLSTGDAGFPEVMVKMVDASAAPAPFGGAFWFFYSPLTDVTFTITVTDHLRGLVRTYSSGGSAGFCGGGDTNAFPP